MEFHAVLVPASRGLDRGECARLAPHFDLRTAQTEPQGPPGTLLERFDVQRSAARAIELQLNDLLDERRTNLARYMAHEEVYLVLWTRPGAPFLCLEAWTGYSDPEGFAGDLFEKPAMRSLAPGARARHQAVYRYFAA